MPLITPAEVARYLGLPDVPDTLIEVIAAVEAAIGERCGPLSPTPVTRTVECNGPGFDVALPIYPAIQVTRAVSTTGTELDPAQLTVNDAGVLSGLPPGTWTVTYLAGRTTCPDDLRRAVLDTIRDHMDRPTGSRVIPPTHVYHIIQRHKTWP